MTYERVFAIWRGNSMATASEYLEMTDLVSKAIIKQIPRKPTSVDNCENVSISERCCNCYEIIDDTYSHCPYCGQAIDWSDNE